MATYNTANETLAATYEDHDWTKAVFDTNTTAGIQLTLKAQSAAIQALADHIDGVDPANPKPAPDKSVAGQADRTSAAQARQAQNPNYSGQGQNPAYPNQNPNPNAI